MREHRLREFREKAGLTRAELGEKSGVNFRTIEKYEQGRGDMYEAQYSNLRALADALGVKVDDFFD